VASRALVTLALEALASRALVTLALVALVTMVASRNPCQYQESERHLSREPGSIRARR